MRGDACMGANVSARDCDDIIYLSSISEGVL